MLIAGIIGKNDRIQTANLISSFFVSTGKKISIVDSGNLIDLSPQRFRDYINVLSKNNVDILILKIDIYDMQKEVFDHLQFDIMIYTDKADDLKEVDSIYYKELMRKNLSLLNEKGIAIVNVDDSELIQFLRGMKFYTITYGFNSKASITTSSIGDTVFKDNFMCCLQRTISTNTGELVEPQEYRISMKSSEFDAYNVLAAATFAIVNGLDLNSLDYSGINN